MKKTLLMALACMMALTGAARSNKNDMKDSSDQGVKVELQTTLGDITLLLYNDTPQHRDNFVKLVEEGYYDGVLFHRVIKDFMVQTGDPDSKNARPGQMLGSGSPDYTIPAEIDYPKHFHKYGALAAARTGDQVNPERRSSGSQFYIVTGQKVSPQAVSKLEQRLTTSTRQAYLNRLLAEHADDFETFRKNADSNGMVELRRKLMNKATIDIPEQTLPAEVVEAYTTVGGAPHLDGAYTVFGEVLSGMDVVEKIQNAATDGNDRPKEDIRVISAKVVK